MTNFHVFKKISSLHFFIKFYLFVSLVSISVGCYFTFSLARGMFNYPYFRGLMWPNNLTMEMKKETERNSVKEMVVKTPVCALSWSAFSVTFPNSQVFITWSEA